MIDNICALFLILFILLYFTSCSCSKPFLKVRSIRRCRIAAHNSDVLAFVPLRVTRGRGFREICEFLFNCGRNHKGERLREVA